MQALAISLHYNIWEVIFLHFILNEISLSKNVCSYKTVNTTSTNSSTVATKLLAPISNLVGENYPSILCNARNEHLHNIGDEVTSTSVYSFAEDLNFSNATMFPFDHIVNPFLPSSPYLLPEEIDSFAGETKHGMVDPHSPQPHSSCETLILNPVISYFNVNLKGLNVNAPTFVSNANLPDLNIEYPPNVTASEDKVSKHI